MSDASAPFPFAVKPLDYAECPHARKQWAARPDVPGFAVLWCLNCKHVIAAQHPSPDGLGVIYEERPRR